MTKREIWMQEYERILIEKRPILSGKIDWDTAVYLYNKGITAENAALRMIEHLG